MGKGYLSIYFAPCGVLEKRELINLRSNIKSKNNSSNIRLILI